MVEFSENESSGEGDIERQHRLLGVGRLSNITYSMNSYYNSSPKFSCDRWFISHTHLYYIRDCD